MCVDSKAKERAEQVLTVFTYHIQKKRCKNAHVHHHHHHSPTAAVSPPDAPRGSRSVAHHCNGGGGLVDMPPGARRAPGPLRVARCAEGGIR